MGHITPLPLCIHTHNHATAETSVIQLSVVEMKFLLASLIVVAFIITSSSLVTALLMGDDTSSCSVPTNGTVTVVCQIGEKGQQGDTGPPGHRGVPGMRGPQSLPGSKGEMGARGKRGVKGKRGAQGEHGDKGEPGVDGRKGEPGVRGEKGLQGAPGGFIANLTEPQYKQLKEELYRQFIDNLSDCALPDPSTHQCRECSGSSMDIPNPPIPPTTSQQIAQTSGLGQATVVSSRPSNLITTSTVQPTRTPTPTPWPLHCAGTTVHKPATSCKEIYNCFNLNAKSGPYWIRNATGSSVQVFCEMDTNNCGDIAGGWMRVAYIDMLQNKTCPQGLNYTSKTTNVCTGHGTQCVNSIKHMCTSSHTDKYDCSSVPVQTHGVNYSMVCGQARGYQYRYTPAFRGSHYDGEGFLSTATLNDAYVSGLSVTYGNPPNRSHIWTFAAGWSKNYSYTTTNCPCAKYRGLNAPDFVGENYFCESGNPGRVERMRWNFNDTLWDSEGCDPEETCCDHGPWFDVELDKEVRDDIEVRMCHYFDNRTENIGVDLLEIYIY